MSKGIDVSEIPAVKVLPYDFAVENTCIGMRWLYEDELLVGVSNEIDENEVTKILQKIRKTFKIEAQSQRVNTEHLLQIIDNSYSEVTGEEFSHSKSINPQKESSIAELVNNILARAIDFRASDIHIEPTETDLHIRARIDGKMETVTRLKSEFAAPVVSRLKVLARMNIVERRRPQDGQFSFTIGTKTIDVRLATVATLFGEKLVLRVLDSSKALSDIRDLGITEEDLKLFDQMVKSNFGLIVAAGPTGSGKTTTLHSAIRNLNTSDKNLTTLEDPVEYVVEGVNHIPIDESIGAGFAVQLRAILRQDPDVVLVGETRDSETARIAIQGALSGRLVLTSLHAPDAVGVIYRLFQMDIEPHLVAASLNGIVAQRLVRKICVYCKQTHRATASERAILKVASDVSLTLAHGVGCAMCRGTGYFDRVGVFQLLLISDSLREVISRRPSPNELYEAAKREKLKTLEDSALRLVYNKQTTLEEISHLIGSGS
jgi:type IV pilus assembly protein PilB